MKLTRSRGAVPSMDKILRQIAAIALFILAIALTPAAVDGQRGVLLRMAATALRLENPGQTCNIAI